MNVQERINMRFGNDSQEIKSWVDNDNHAYRLGDVVLHAGKYFDDLKSCTLTLHSDTLAAKYLQRPEYKANPAIAKNRIRNMEVFNEVLTQSCPKPMQGQSTKTAVMVHLRLGDGVYGEQKVAVLRTPYPLRCYAQLLQNYNTSTYKIGLVHNNTASSIFSVSSSPLPDPVSGGHTEQRGDENNDGEHRVAQYLLKLKVMFPNAYDFDPEASPDEHFCAMVTAPVLVTGKGT